jgi:nitrate reductase gamma subunit
MNWNILLFVVFPYVALTLAIGGTIYRRLYRPFTVSSLSSQLLENRKLFWGSVPFHWGITIILLFHLLALLVPAGFEAWNREPVRLLALEGTGLALAIWSLAGLGVLLYRRVTDDKIRAVTSSLDLVVLAILAGQVVTGIWIAVGYRYGSHWAPAVVVPYVRSLLALQPRPELVLPLPHVVQLHACCSSCFWPCFRSRGWYTSSRCRYPT